MIEKRKIAQLSLVAIGLLLVVFTYFLYPINSKDKFLKTDVVKEKINLQQEEIAKLEEKEQTLIHKMQEKREYLSSEVIKKQKKIEKLEVKEQALVLQIQEKKEYLSSGGILKKDALKNLQTDLQKNSLSLTKKRAALEKEEKKVKGVLENLQTDLQKTSSSLVEKRAALEEEVKKKSVLEKEKRRINLQQKEIAKLEEKEQTLIHKMQEKREYFSSEVIKKQKKIEKLEVKEQALIDEIEVEEEYASSGGILKKDALKNLQTDLQKTSSSLTKKRAALEKEKKKVKDVLENLQTDLQKTSSSLVEKRAALEEEGKVVKNDEDKSNIFKNVEYGGLYDFDKPFTISSEEAYISAEEPNIVYMTSVYVILHVNDERTVVITSDRGNYNKATYDCFFIDNVKATDGETIILSKNLDLLATEDTAIVYNNVYLTNDNGSLKADKVNYDFETKFYTVNMWSSNERVKAKLIQ